MTATSVEVSEYRVRAEDFEVAKARLEDCHPGFAQNQNNFAATVARRELLELCVRIADQFGSEIRNEPLRLGKRMVNCSLDYDSVDAAMARAYEKVQP